MNFTYAETKEISNIGKTIKEKSNEFNQKITELFKLLSEFKNEKWSGNQAEKYASFVALDKKQYTDYADEINKFGEKIIKTAESIEKCAKTIMMGEEYKG